MISVLLFISNALPVAVKTLLTTKLRQLVPLNYWLIAVSFQVTIGTEFENLPDGYPKYEKVGEGDPAKHVFSVRFSRFNGTLEYKAIIEAGDANEDGGSNVTGGASVMLASLVTLLFALIAYGAL